MDEEWEHVSLLWDTNSWAFSNSGGGGGGSDEKSGGNNNLKQMDSSSNSPAVVAVATARGKELEVGQVGKKRGRGGGEVKQGKKGGGGGSGGGGGESDHDIHIWTERERRKKMRNMFSNLHALLPQLPPKADKSTIVDEAVSYIKTLQNTLQKLQKQKLERLRPHGAATTTNNYEPYSSSIITQQNPAYDSRESFLADQGASNHLGNAFSHVNRFPTIFQTWTSQNVILNVCGNDAQISVCSQKKPGILASILYVLEKHSIEVVSAHVASDYDRRMYMIQAHASSGYSDQFLDSFPMEEVYKQAAGEIMFWVS